MKKEGRAPGELGGDWRAPASVDKEYGTPLEVSAYPGPGPHPNRQPPMKWPGSRRGDWNHMRTRPTPRHIAYLPGAEAFRFVDELLTWLDTRTLTLEDAEATIRHACDLSDGMTPDGLTRFFLESHQLPKEDAIMVGQLAALMLYRGKLQRLPGGRYASTTGKPEPNVIALLRVPLSEWEALSLGQYLHKGRAAYVAGVEDRA